MHLENLQKMHKNGKTVNSKRSNNLQTKQKQTIVYIRIPYKIMLTITVDNLKILYQLILSSCLLTQVGVFYRSFHTATSCNASSAL